MIGVVACAQTTTTKSTSPQTEETLQTSPSENQTATESAESEQTKSKSGATPTAGESAGEKSQSPSPAVVESESQKIEQKSSTEQVSGGDSADLKLAEARENLRISQETEKRIAAELEQLKKSGNASDENVGNYETYLKSVEAMTAENREIVEQMKAAYTDNRSGRTGSGQNSVDERNEMADPSIPEEQVTDEVAALDRQLNTSLAKFDGLLLKEMDEIRAGSSRKLQDLAQEAAEAAKRLREKGLDVDTATSGSPGDSREDTQDTSRSDQEMESRDGRTGTDTASKTGSRRSGEGSSRKDQRRADYEDDDIVARQLREAAENETDPELKEKLWKEYEEYKKSK
ncbi:MAG: hypothetical protein GY850_39490 [bacterium]|nr:hypothetical protein [bacterium]